MIFRRSLSLVPVAAALGSLSRSAAQDPVHASSPAPAASATVYTLPDTPLAAFQNAKLPHSIDDDHELLLGGIGSDLWHGPQDKPDEFWMVTDRGPNGQVKVGEDTRRTFPVATFDPTIVHVQVAGGVIRILEALPILTASGKPVTGLPNIEKHDETPYDFTAQTKLAWNQNGLDTEGLVRTSRGDFWLCDEYAPSLVHVDKDGKVVARYVPADAKYDAADYPVVPALPALFGKRKSNRGFEAIALGPDEKTVYAVMQSPLSNPDKKTGDASRSTRILAFDVASQKATAEYAYLFEDAQSFGEKSAPGDMKVSGAVCLGGSRLLVLERTDEVARVYLADLARATNLLGTQWDDPKTTPSLEALDPSAGPVVAVSKKLVVDLNQIDGHPDKIEGIAVVDATTLAFVNDNDFDIGDFDASGRNKGAGVKISLVVARLREPLPSGK